MKKILQPYYKGPQSDHFDGIHFFNPWDPQTNSLRQVLYWKMTSKQKPWPKQKELFLSDIPPIRLEGNLLRVSFVGHSTMLIQTQGLNILTDPIWSDRASPFKYLGPVRYAPPGISFDKLPPIDFILISHNHYDHLDIPTIKKIWDRDHPKIITPLGNDLIIQREDSSIRVDTLDWHELLEINENVRIHLAPAQHWSRRNAFDKNKALWGAFIIETLGGNIYFCGDSGFGTGKIFRETFERFGSFRFALLPIGAYEPRWFMKSHHMNPEEAVLAYKLLGEPYAAAIHFQTFRLADEGFFDPREQLAAMRKKNGISQQRFRALQIGEAWMIPEESD